MSSSSARTVVVAAFLTAGCSSGSGGSNGSNGTGGSPEMSTVAVSMRDAPSDHITRFEVDVTAVDLVRQDGLAVSVLPGRTRLDLAQLVTVSQLLAVTAVPRGTYLSMKVSIDSTTAAVAIDGATTSARLLDEGGAPLSGIITRSIDMRSKPIECLPGLTRYVEIDFDLDASCRVDAAANTVFLGPVLKAESEPARPVDTGIGGILSEIQDAAQGNAGTFTIELRPPAATWPGPKVRITTSANTAIFLDGKPSSFGALRSFPIGGPICAHGQLSAGRDTLVADRVQAMTPTDVVDGLVLARSVDGVLTVSGRSVDFPAGTIRDGTFTVRAAGARINVGGMGGPAAAPGTAPPALAHDAIAVGQRIDARGDLDGDTLDCAKGWIILVGTPVAGRALGPVTGGVLLLAIDRIAGRLVTDLDFSVGGTASADPKAFAVATGTLTVATIVSGTPIVAGGILTPWNAPSGAPDMTAIVLADRTNVSAVLQCGWSTPTGKPFAAIGPTGFVLDLSGTNAHQVDAGQPTPQQLAPEDRPAAQAAPGAKLNIVQGGSVTTHSDMASFAADAGQRLGTAKARALGVKGQWDPNAKKMAATEVTLALE